MIPTLQDIQQAHNRIRPYIHHTPIMTCQTINKMLGANVYFKCENFQKIGAFKARGGLNAVLSLNHEDQQKGIVTHSSGNHAQAIAFAAQLRQIPAYIVMPSNAPIVKINAVRGYGANVILCEPTLQAREDGVNQVIKETGATFIHPFNNYEVITGQATAAKELLEDLNIPLDILIAPVGGGGLLSGTALTVQYLSPQTKVIAGEPTGAADAILSLQSGKIEKAPYINTIADGLLTNLGDKTFDIIKRQVSDVWLADDDETKKAMKLVWERMKIIIEPSSAVPLAALFKNKEKIIGQHVGLIISGGNIDISQASTYWA
jgi:threonine dehydratase